MRKFYMRKIVVVTFLQEPNVKFLSKTFPEKISKNLLLVVKNPFTGMTTLIEYEKLYKDKTKEILFYREIISKVIEK